MSDIHYIILIGRIINPVKGDSLQRNNTIRFFMREDWFTILYGKASF